MLQPKTNSLGGTYYEGWGVLDPAGDRDYFRFEAEAGQWVGIMTRIVPHTDADEFDTVLTLLDDSGATQLAQSYYIQSVSTSDSEIIHRFEHSGSYCVEAMEQSD